MKFTIDLGGSTIDLLYTINNIKKFHSLESKLFNKNNIKKILENFNILNILKNSKLIINNKNTHKLIITGGHSALFKQKEIILKSEIFIIKIVSEFKAIGKGAEICSKKESGIAVSLGTGTAMVLFNSKTKEYKHIKGTGLGGGSFIGLSKALLNTSDFQEISNLALLGKKENINLSVGEIVGGNIRLLPASATASNFAKYNTNTSKEDIALGIAIMIAESITALAIEKCLRYKQKYIVFGGKFSKLSILKKHVQESTELFNITPIFPTHSEYMTVIGAEESG